MVTFPEQSDKPKTLREKIYGFTPVALTVLATILAGVSSGELTRSQYFRSLAAQRQAKASDQWGYYQAKRNRAVEAESSLDILVSSVRPGRLEFSRVTAASGALVRAATGSVAEAQARILDKRLAAMAGDAELLAAGGGLEGILPAVADKQVGDADVQEALAEIAQQKSEAEMTPLLRRISGGQLEAAMRTADENLAAFDQAVGLAGNCLDQMRLILLDESSVAGDLVRQGIVGAENVQRDVAAAGAEVAAARFRFGAERYDREAKYNGVSAQLLEVQVSLSGVDSERYRGRSAKFFYGMLAAQAGVTISTLSLAVRRKSIFWSMAAAAGAAAVAFSGYVYLWT